MFIEIEAAINDISGKNPNIFIFGDFNIPNVDWSKDIILSSAPQAERDMYYYLKEIRCKYFLHQVIHIPTHKDGNTLDLLFTNNQELVHSYQAIPTLMEISHHCMIEVSTSYDLSCNLVEENIIPDQSLNQYNYFDENINWD